MKSWLIKVARFHKLWLITAFKLWRADWLRDHLRAEIEEIKRQAGRTK